ncbi:MAG: GIY-YIG nuclease family protein [Prochloraceae cyanobacterium]|nr:GIY-YIG nuclease family protein [Prochloraceae cyanobacterium]
MSEQLNLFETKDRVLPPRQQQLVMDKDALVRWKSRIFKYQQQVRNTQQPQQNELFNLPQAYGSPDDIDPFSLKLHSALFYRMPEPQGLVDNIDTGCIYFVIDNAVPLLLYVGETKLTAAKRWKGVHYVKDYILKYIELHRRYDLEEAIVSAFWHRVPPNKKILRQWEKELILKWRSPFNKECWQWYGQPFGK